jgi:hypothetical protein
MQVVSVLTGKHTKWGGEETKTPIESTDISVAFAERIRKARGEEDSGEETSDSENEGSDDSDSDDLEDVDIEGKEGEVAEAHGRGRPEDLGVEEGEVAVD